MSTVFILEILLAIAILLVFLFYRNLKNLKNEIEYLHEWITHPKTTEKKELKNALLSKIQKEAKKLIKQSQKRKKLKIKMDAKLKLKNRQRNDMISAIVHEFRNPIAVIVGYATTLQDNKNIDVDVREKFLDKIYSNSQKIESLLSKLVLWNKFENGQTTLNVENFHLLPLINEVKNSLLEKYPYRIINIYGKDRVVNADKILIEIVLKNLIENAIKYSKDNVDVIIEEKIVKIVDRGVGISAQDIEKVTKKFFRSGEHSWDNSMGLGLYIVKKILNMHDSDIIIESELNKGSSFSFEI